MSLLNSCFEVKNALWDQGKRLSYSRHPKGSSLTMNCNNHSTAKQAQPLDTPTASFGFPLYHWPQERMEIIWWIFPHYSIWVWMCKTQSGPDFLKKIQKIGRCLHKTIASLFDLVLLYPNSSVLILWHFSYLKLQFFAYLSQLSIKRKKTKKGKGFI